MVLELIEMAPERHVIAHYEVFAADSEQLTKLHACSMQFQVSFDAQGSRNVMSPMESSADELGWHLRDKAF